MHALLKVFSMLMLSVVVPLNGTAQTLELPNIGDYSQQYLSQDTERRLGLAILQRIRDRGLVIDDVQLNEYLASVGQRIAAYAEQTSQPYTFFWIDAATINAFATPGGFIGVNSGLFLATRNEGELAGVMAHEIAHVSQRHIARAIADAKRLALPIAAALVASAVLAAASDSDAGQAALAGTMAVGAQRQINFTRANEQEADRVGYQLLAQAGFDGNSMADFFARLQRLSGGVSDQAPDYLLTHPRPTSRMADTQNRSSAIPSASSVLPRDKTAYFLAKARMLVMTTTNTGVLLQHFKKTLQTGDYEHADAERYGYTLALKRAGHYDDALVQIARLRKSDSDRLAYRIEEAEILLAKGERERAWRMFEDAKGLYPDDYTLAIHYGRALTTQGDPRAATTLLQPHLRRRINDASLYALYAQAAQRAGDAVATHVTLAEYYYLNNQLDAAIEQVELGLKNPTVTPYQQAQLRARLKQLRQQQQTEEQRFQ